MFDPVRHHDYVERLIAHPGARATAGAPPAGAVRPVFIVGMPRSGTTLVERILGRHPAVALGGEREDLPRLLRELADRTGQAYPECLGVLDQAGLDELAQQYLRAGPAPAAGITHATDKLPDNYLRLGLIDRLFPDALIVHVRRDPRAVCWSNYEQDFGRTLRFSYRLDHLVSVYRDYRRIMAHWRSCLNRPILDVDYARIAALSLGIGRGALDATIDIDYERLVAEPEPQARLLLAFCGLNWHSDCVRPEDCEAPIHTASMWQARQPVYSGSVDRWRHYRPWLQVLEALAENPSSAA